MNLIWYVNFSYIETQTCKLKPHQQHLKTYSVLCAVFTPEVSRPNFLVMTALNGQKLRCVAFVGQAIQRAILQLAQV